MHQVLFHIGSKTVYSYAVMATLAALACITVGYIRLRPRGFSLVSVLTLALTGTVGGVVGARLFYVLGHLKSFSKGPTIGGSGGIISLQMAGLVLYGAIILGGASIIVTALILKMKIWQVGDALGLGFFAGLTVGRVGCFLNGCCGGKPTGLPWGVTFPGSAVKVHPTQIYEIILGLMAFGLLLYLDRYLERDGEIFFLSLAFYGVIRFSMEFLRFHSDGRAGLVFQLLSVGILLASVAFLVWGRRWLPLKEPAGLVGDAGQNQESPKDEGTASFHAQDGEVMPGAPRGLNEV